MNYIGWLNNKQNFVRNISKYAPNLFDVYATHGDKKIDSEQVGAAYDWIIGALNAHWIVNRGYIPPFSTTWICSISLTSCCYHETIVDRLSKSSELHELKVNVFYRYFLLLASELESYQFQKRKKSNFHELNDDLICKDVSILLEARDTNEMVLRATIVIRDRLGIPKIEDPDEYLLPT